MLEIRHNNAIVMLQCASHYTQFTFSYAEWWRWWL